MTYIDGTAKVVNGLSPPLPIPTALLLLLSGLGGEKWPENFTYVAVRWF